MMKYLLYFFVLVSVFLTSGSSSTPENQQKYNDIYTMYSPNEDKTEYNIPQADIERYEKELYAGKQNYNNDNGVLNPFSFRHLSPLKILRFNIPSVTIRILSSLKIQLPKNQWTGFSYYTNLFKYSDRYHIYSLGHILI